VSRSARPDGEGFYYFAKTADGWLYGPYSLRSTAAGVLTQMDRYARQPKYIFDYRTSTRVLNPRWNPDDPKGEVLKAKVSAMQPAPYESQREKLDKALTQVRKYEEVLARLAERYGIDVEVH
jgi:hypothetical protein